MGCQQSTPLQVDPTFVTSNTPRKMPTDGPQNGHNTKQMTRSGRSNTTTSTSPSSVVPTVSLEVDEEVSYEIPKVIM